MIRLYAPIHATGHALKAKHYVGLPPELTGGSDYRTSLPAADLLVLVQEREHTVFLYRYTREGEFAGDTWHENVEDVLDQAKFEYGEALGAWAAIPEDAPDPTAYALSHLP